MRSQVIGPFLFVINVESSQVEIRRKTTGETEYVEQFEKAEEPHILAGGICNLGSGKNLVLEFAEPDSTYRYSILDVSKRPKRLSVITNIQTRACIDESNWSDKIANLVVTDSRPYFGQQSVGAELRLVVRNGVLTIDQNSMRRYIAAIKSIAGDAKDIKRMFSATDSDSPPQLTSECLQLLYAGRADLARQLVRQSWPENRTGESEYWQSLLHQAQSSKLWTFVQSN